MELVVLGIIAFVLWKVFGGGDEGQSYSSTPTQSQSYGYDPSQINTYIAGLPHRTSDWKAMMQSIPVGSYLFARRESSNAHDFNAIALYKDGRHVGYIPRAENPPFARHMDKGGNLAVRVLSKDMSSKWEGVKIQVVKTK